MSPWRLAKENNSVMAATAEQSALLRRRHRRIRRLYYAYRTEKKATYTLPYIRGAKVTVKKGCESTYFEANKLLCLMILRTYQIKEFLNPHQKFHMH